MPVRLHHAEGPQALHLVRLAQGSPGQWVTLPGRGLRVLGLTGAVTADAPGWLLCLKGEAVVDLPDLNFVRLRVGEAFAPAGSWKAVPTREGTVLLLVPADPDA